MKMLLDVAGRFCNDGSAVLRACVHPHFPLGVLAYAGPCLSAQRFSCKDHLLACPSVLVRVVVMAGHGLGGLPIQLCDTRKMYGVPTP